MDAAKNSEAGPSSSSSRRVSFLSKCQVILPQYDFADDPVDDYFGRQAAAAAAHDGKEPKKSGRLHLPFRSSKKSRRWSSASASGTQKQEQQQQHDRQHHPHLAAHTRPGSVPIQSSSMTTASSYSPSLPISRDGTANRLRQKLISPPPPEPETPLSPASGSAELSPVGRSGRLASDTPPIAMLSSPSSASSTNSPASPSSQQASLSSPPSLQSTVPGLARPVAVRKPLTFGFDKEDDDESTAPDRDPKLHVPPIVYAARTPKRSMSVTPSPKGDKPPVLSWRDSGSSTDEDDDDEDDDEDDNDDDAVSFEEEDLRGECTCVDCEKKMIAALSPTYAPHWTRGARRKYLADRKEILHEESRKAVRPPIWLRSEESEAAATSKLRDIYADEVDAKQGVSRRESVAKSTIDDGQLPSAVASTADALNDADSQLRKEVDEEVRLREEEHRLKKTRCEMRRLSSDFGSGLRTGSGVMGGGGARAMMRQLEEAEQAERRAKVERSRSPRLDTDDKDVARPMGAVAQELPIKPFTPPPRIVSPVVDSSKSSAAQNGTGKPDRSPSPLKRALSASLPGGKSKGVEGGLTTTTKPNGSLGGGGGGGGIKQGASNDSPPDRHPSPSLLIRRELTLGIPVQSNTAARSRNSWQQTPGASKFASPDATATSASVSQPSSPPRLKSPDGTLSKLNDIAEVPSSLNSSPRRAALKGAAAQSATMVRSNSMDVAATIASTSTAAVPDSNTRPAPGVRRANTIGTAARRRTSLDQTDSLRSSSSNSGGGGGNGSHAHRASMSSSSPLHSSASSGAVRPPHLINAVVATPAHFVEARIDKAKARARSSFKDLVARIKN